MIKVKIMFDFTDKVTGKECKKGTVAEFTAKRINEINDAGKYIRLVEDAEPKTEPKAEQPTGEKKNK